MCVCFFCSRTVGFVEQLDHLISIGLSKIMRFSTTTIGVCVLFLGILFVDQGKGFAWQCTFTDPTSNLEYDLTTVSANQSDHDGFENMYFCF